MPPARHSREQRPKSRSTVGPDRGPYAKKALGQHFLADANILARIVDFSGVGAEDTVLEIGPGLGALTRQLAARVHQVIAVEIDSELVRSLRTTLPANVDLIETDALEIDFQMMVKTPYHVVANLPYNIATPLIGRMVAARRAISSVTVLLQKEVADRILASPGTPAYGPLSVGVQCYARVEAGFVVPAGAFVPKPKVDSRLVRLGWRPGAADVAGFEKFVQSTFRERRKKLVNCLTAPTGLGKAELAMALRQMEISPEARPGDLTVDQFLCLHRHFSRPPRDPDRPA